jgi:hypothetical protein
VNLREARKKKKLDAFMTERDDAPTRGDASERFQKLTRAMLRGQGGEKPPSKSQTSRKASAED